MSTESEQAYERMVAGLPPRAKEPPACRHEQFAASVSIARLEDTGRFVCEVRLLCVECREPFRFLGMKAGLAHGIPTCSIDGTEAYLPVEPEVEARLFASARYVLGPPPEPRH